ncbi:unnamed protein product, partial [Musa hybrid cultivar]
DRRRESQIDATAPPPPLDRSAPHPGFAPLQFLDFFSFISDLRGERCVFYASFLIASSIPLDFVRRFSLSFILRNIFFLLGLSENPSPSKDSTKADSHSSSRSNTGLKVLLICLGAIALVLLSYFLFKKWQKKKREEQHARLLKLFEEDDDLEVELGLRD